MVDYNKSIRIAAGKAEMDEDKYREMVDMYFAVLQSQLAEGNDVCVHKNIGSIVLRERAGENVRGGTPPKRYLSPAFKATAGLKKLLRQSDDAYAEMLSERKRLQEK